MAKLAGCTLDFRHWNIMSAKKEGGGGPDLSGQIPLRMTKPNCRWSLSVSRLFRTPLSRNASRTLPTKLEKEGKMAAVHTLHENRSSLLIPYSFPPIFFLNEQAIKVLVHCKISFWKYLLVFSVSLCKQPSSKKACVYTFTFSGKTANPI